MPSIEAESYEDDRPRKPWYGQLDIQIMKHGPVLRLQRTHNTTGNNYTVDTDSNATAIVQPKDLFDCEDDANKEYRRRLAAWAAAKLLQVQEALKELAE